MRRRRKFAVARLGFLKVRIFTLVIIGLGELAGLIGCAVIMGKSGTILAPQAVPGIVYYILFLVFEATFGIYFVLATRRYYQDRLRRNSNHGHHGHISTTGNIL